jgi:hypothetical protein
LIATLSIEPFVTPRAVAIRLPEGVTSAAAGSRDKLVPPTIPKGSALKQPDKSRVESSERLTRSILLEIDQSNYFINTKLENRKDAEKIIKTHMAG